MARLRIVLAERGKRYRFGAPLDLICAILSKAGLIARLDQACFQPLPFPSGTSAGAYSGVRSISSKAGSSSVSARDLS